jgi:flagellar protein FlaF
MGFSVSGSAAIIFVGLFIAFGMWYTASANTLEQVTDAQEQRADGTLAEKNTAIEIATTNYSTDTLTVTVNNTGTTTLSLNQTDLVVDNAYQQDWQADATVDGNSATDLWTGGETLAIEITLTQPPSQVKIITEHGVADAEAI